MVPMLGGAFPMKFFAEPAEALDWLGWARDAEATTALDAFAPAANGSPSAQIPAIDNA